MNQRSKSLIFFGNERLSTGYKSTAPILKGLINAGYKIGAVVINQADKEKSELEVYNLAINHKIPVIASSKTSDLIIALKKIPADIGVLVAYGRIISPEILNLLPLGIINLHPSLLPKYRGPTPIEQVILDNSSITGVSIIRLTAEMDAGPIYAQKSIKVAHQQTKQELTDRLLAEGGHFLLEVLPSILEEDLQPIPQDNSQATYCSLITKQTGLIDWLKPAWQIEREVRAYAGWPKSYFLLKTTSVTIIKCIVKENDLNLKPAEMIVTSENHLLIGCLNSAIEILELQLAGKKIISVKDFINGYGRLINNIVN